LDAYDSRLVKQFRAKVEKEIAEKLANIVDSEPVDHAAFRSRAGHIKGLRRSIEIINELEQDLRQPRSEKKATVSSGPNAYEA
jgi:hypothetical protein